MRLATRGSDAVLELMTRADRRCAARRRAERYTWEAATRGFLRTHESISDQSTRHPVTPRS